MSNDDEEAQLTNTHAHAAIDADHENDDRSFDGMEVEDWLMKQHHQQAKISDIPKRPKEEELPAGSLRERLNGKKQGNEMNLQEEDKPLKVGDVGNIVALPPPTSEIFTLGTRTEDSLEGTTILNAEVTTLASYLNFFVAEMVPQQDNPVLVIEGVKAIDPRRRRVFLFLGGLVVASLVAIAAALMNTGIRKSSRTSVLAGDAGLNVFSNTTTLGPPTRMSGGGNLSLTLGDAVISSPGGILSFAAANGAIDIFQKFVSRTDKNFTYFSSSKMAKFLGGISMSFIQKSLSREWSGHVLSGLESTLVEGMVPYEDMYDGMVLRSIAGYPLLIQFDPLRINNNIVIPTELNVFFKNGVVHNTYEFPKPLVPWLGKSIYDVLLETNEAHQGNLSMFIGLIDVSPNFKVLLQEGEGLAATTLFAPTNDAMAKVDPNILADPMLLQDFLLNHVVSGNFVRCCWWIIPTGIQVSKTKLTLRTHAEQILSVEINDVVIINDKVTIFQEDIFSEMGTMHVIDLPLLC